MQEFITVSFDEAVEKSINLIEKETPKEYISCFDALGRVLAEPITCKKDLPSFNNSAMDGFAFSHKDLGKTLKIKETIYAGMNISACLNNDECYKIMTGAKIPSDVDTIIPFENCIHYDENEVTLDNKTKKGSAFRFKGEEQAKGNILCNTGDVINSSVIAMLASQGITTIGVYKKISIAIFSTGDELKEPWDKASENEIYNVNSSALLSLLNEHGFQADYCGVIPDNLEESIQYFSKMKRYDAIVTTGGISMGEADFVEEALKSNGFKESFHGINIKPGKPTMMGTMGDTLVASMPGNPLAAYVNTFLLLIPALKKLQGCTNFVHEKVLANNSQKFSVKPGRVNIVLGNLKDGNFVAFNNNKYASGMITPIINSNVILISKENDSIIEENTQLKVVYFK
ncbi:molybdopterin molybdotransferase MoeA [Sulfurospirillum arcachonense]|uniref:molybdopterin molybdotransferase MoeA n=1 Tax=Sulfurospirillum arcachonense TaxID=57666 RepID=UPI00046969EF|nr:molybdopterin molybdotransferase MoeA [Sulfurospirillum arcachonense]